MKVEEQTMTRISITLSDSEREEILSHCDGKEISDAIREAVLNFCKGGYTPISDRSSSDSRKSA